MLGESHGEATRLCVLQAPHEHPGAVRSAVGGILHATPFDFPCCVLCVCAVVSCRYYAVFDLLLADANPKVYKHLRKHNVPHNLYLFRWLQTMFLKVLPLDAAGRVWDWFFLDGAVVMLKVAVAILSLLSPTMLKDDDMETTFVAGVDWAGVACMSRRGLFTLACGVQVQVVVVLDRGKSAAGVGGSKRRGGSLQGHRRHQCARGGGTQTRQVGGRSFFLQNPRPSGGCG